jgi:hypothetical protein
MRHEMSDAEVEALAREMAEAINGGSWETDYADAQREGWRLNARFCFGKMNEAWDEGMDFAMKG